MAKIQLTPIGSFTQSAITTINANMDRITTTLDRFISRDGTSPNQLTADIDLNDNDLLNVNKAYLTELWIDGVQWAGPDIDVIEGPKGDPGEGWAPVFGIVNDGARRVLRLVDYIGGDATKPTDNIGDYVGTSGYTSNIASAVDIRGPQGVQGTAGAGTGDMLESMYDPTGVNDDAFSMDNMVETAGSKVMTAAERTKLAGLAAVDAANVDAAGAVMNTDTSTAAMQFVVNENNMTSNSSTKIPTQASVKAYVDNHQVIGVDVQAYDAQLFSIIPVNSKSAAYTLVATDRGKMIYHPSADTTARIWTIPANSSVAFPIGTTVTFDNDIGAGAITIAITTDTLVLVGAGTTGSRTLAPGGQATAVKVTSTRWRISGVGLT